MIIEPSADARTASAAIWQMYLALTQQGFTPDQAMILVCQMLANGRPA